MTRYLPRLRKPAPIWAITEDAGRSPVWGARPPRCRVWHIFPPDGPHTCSCAPWLLWPVWATPPWSGRVSPPGLLSIGDGEEARAQGHLPIINAYSLVLEW